MRTYDKLIAAICSGQGAVGLRPALGGIRAAGLRLTERSAALAQELIPLFAARERRGHAPFR